MGKWIKRCTICKIHLDISYPNKICFKCEKAFGMIGVQKSRITKAVNEQDDIIRTFRKI